MGKRNRNPRRSALANTPMATSWLISGVPHLLFLLLRVSGAAGHKVVQPQDFVSVRAGETLRLGCTVTGAAQPGPVKWFLGKGPPRKLVYADNGSFERVLRTDKASNTDFSIAIQNVTREDSGTYYCVKQRHIFLLMLDWKSGPGTQVVVEGAEGPEFMVVQPQDFVSVRAGETLRLGCTVTGAAQPGPVKWFLGKDPPRKLVYADNESFERVLRTDKASNTDFSIAIQNVTLEDGGTYYCVKQKKEIGNDKDVKTGRGTRVVVNAHEGFPHLAVWTGVFLSKIVVTSFLICFLQKKEA